MGEIPRFKRLNIKVLVEKRQGICWARQFPAPPEALPKLKKSPQLIMIKGLSLQARRECHRRAVTRVVFGGDKVARGGLTLGTVRLLDPAARLAARRRWGWNHQSEALQKQDRALRGASPDELATFALAILNVDVSA
jgi:hypothetical protein